MPKTILLLSLLLALQCRAWRHVIYSPDIASLTVMAGDDWQRLPVTTMTGKAINIDFDCLSHDYHRYTYSIEHCEPDWQTSESLFPSDYIEGFLDDNTIDSGELSQDTYQLYTHYHLSIPNQNCRLTMSGNYRLTVFDEDDDPVLAACFMLTDEAATLSMACSANTDIDVNKEHQQIAVVADLAGLKATAPDRQLRLVVMQNGNFRQAVVNPRPQYKTNTFLKWDHCRELIFPAGNEYYKFETLDPTHTTMGLEAVGWDAEHSAWHAYVFPNEERRNYVYDTDANGAFLIRNSDYDSSNTKCDYINTHFSLAAPEQDGTVYLDGEWTCGQLTPEYEMTRNEETGVYEGTVRLKQGYYSYRYIVLHRDGTTSAPTTERDFFQTENSYQAFLYFKADADRAFRLVAYAHINTII